jgi:hypothetical protein
MEKQKSGKKIEILKKENTTRFIYDSCLHYDLEKNLDYNTYLN